MMKIVQLIAVTLALMLLGCKETSNTEENTVAENSNSTENNKTVDVNELYQFYYNNPENQDQIDENALIDYIIDQDLSPQRSITGLYYQILNEGSGEKIDLGDKLEVHYIGKFMDGKEFDNSYDRDQPLKFPLGRGLIQAWIEGLRYLKEGSKATFLVPSRLAYKDRGFGDLIPPNVPLVFEIEIIKVEK